MKDDLFDIDRIDMLASKVRILGQIALDSVASGREINLIGAIRLLAESTGFGVESKAMRKEIEPCLSSVTAQTTVDQPLESQQ